MMESEHKRRVMHIFIDVKFTNIYIDKNVLTYNLNLACKTLKICYINIRTCNNHWDFVCNKFALIKPKN